MGLSFRLRQSAWQSSARVTLPFVALTLGLLVFLGGCSGSVQPTEDDLPPDAFADLSGNVGAGSSGDSMASGDGFEEEPPIPAPGALPLDSHPAAPAGELARSESVAAMAQRIQAEQEAAAAAQKQVQSPAPQAVVAGTTRQHSRRRRARRARSERVVVRERPFQSSGAWMNGFYFTRLDDASWVDLAQKLYGSPARSEDLKLWNGGAKIEPGTLVYYNSPMRPQDAAAMKSFAQDFGTGTEGYAVRRGDTLSRIAAIRYGGAASWKEIVAENPELRNPDQIDPGMRIQLPPTRISTSVVLEKLAMEGGLSSRPQHPVAQTAPETSHAEPVRVPSSTRQPDGISALAEGIPLSPWVLAGALATLLLGAFLMKRRAA